MRGWAPAVYTMPLPAVQPQAYEEIGRRPEVADLRVVLLCVVNGRLVAPGTLAELRRRVAHQIVLRLESLEGGATAIHSSRGAACGALATAQ